MLRPITAFSVVSAVLALACVLAGCSPPLDWREVRPAGTRLQALMPCKPDTAVRRIPLAGLAVDMHLSGCDAGGATFVIGWAAVPATGLGVALGAWQDATLERAGIAPGPDAPAGTAFVPAGAIALPQSVRLRVQGHAPDGSGLPLQAAWFASGGTGDEPQVLFAAVYREPAAQDAATTFFDSLRLP